MTLFDLLFKHQTIESGVFLDGYEFYSVTPDLKFIYYKNSGFMDNFDFFFYVEEYLNIDPEYHCIMTRAPQEEAEPIFIDYSSLEPLLAITVEGLPSKYRGGHSNPFIAIRGTCDHKCPKDFPVDSYGKTLYMLPCCDKKYVGSTFLGVRDTSSIQVIKDIFEWLGYCKGLNVLIIVFDSVPKPFDEAGRDLDFSTAYFCAVVKGRHIKLIRDTKEIEKLYHEYSSTYWCRDYFIERIINMRADASGNVRQLTDADGAFRLEKPKGIKEA